MLFPRRWTVLYAILCCFLFVLYQYKSPRPFHLSFPPTARPLYSGKPIPQVDLNDGRFHWANVPQRHPVTSLIPLPSGKPHKIPKIQHQFGKESTDAKKTREERLRAVKKSFEHAWQGYKKNAWLSDEVGPLSGRAFNHFGGWAATLVDALGKEMLLIHQ